MSLAGVCSDASRTDHTLTGQYTIRRRSTNEARLPAWIIRTVSQTWFRHDVNESIEEFVCLLPVAYFGFDAHDRSAGSICYEMDTLFCVFVLKECHGWNHETVLIEYLECRPALCEQLDLERVPNQSKLRRN